MLKSYIVFVTEADGITFEFHCKAEDSIHAIEQAQNAYPDAVKFEAVSA
jgi:hypothetical protein